MPKNSSVELTADILRQAQAFAKIRTRASIRHQGDKTKLLLGNGVDHFLVVLFKALDDMVFVLHTTTKDSVK